MMLPPPEEKKVSGYPRGWKFKVVRKIKLLKRP
jgi:hypothetical protein